MRGADRESKAHPPHTTGTLKSRWVHVTELSRLTVLYGDLAQLSDPCTHLEHEDGTLDVVLNHTHMRMSIFIENI